LPLFREGVANDESVSLAYQVASGNHLRCHAGKARSRVLSICVQCLANCQRGRGIERS
jgi:primosomal protein N'